MSLTSASGLENSPPSVLFNGTWPLPKLNVLVRLSRRKEKRSSTLPSFPWLSGSGVRQGDGGNSFTGSTTNLLPLHVDDARLKLLRLTPVFSRATAPKPSIDSERDAGNGLSPPRASPAFLWHASLRRLCRRGREHDLWRREPCKPLSESAPGSTGQVLTPTQLRLFETRKLLPAGGRDENDEDDDDRDILADDDEGQAHLTATLFFW